MLRGGVIIFTAILSVIVLKRKLYKHHLFGIFLVIIGITLVGLVAILYDDNKTSTEKSGSAFLGVIVMLISTLFNASIFVSEEWIF